MNKYRDYVTINTLPTFQPPLLESTPPRHALRATPPHERRGEVNIPSCPRRGGTQRVTGWSGI